MYDVGRLCVKLAGKDAGQTVVIVDKTNDVFVVIDGPVKRKRCNMKHLEPLGDVIKIKKGASTEEVRKALEGKIKFRDKKPRKAGEKPKRKRKVKEKPAKKEKTVKKTKK